jgi:hypothetical protein
VGLKRTRNARDWVDVAARYTMSTPYYDHTQVDSLWHHNIMQQSVSCSRTAEFGSVHRWTGSNWRNVSV